jgi:DNA-binding XRE family transcriptional regulator
MRSVRTFSRAKRMMKKGEISSEIFIFFTTRNHEHIIQNLKLRENLTNKDLAESLGITEPTISRMQNGIILIQPKYWTKLFGLFKDVSYFDHTQTKPLFSSFSAYYESERARLLNSFCY